MGDFKINSLADLNSHHIEGIARMGNKPFRVPLYSHIKGNLWTGGCPVEAVPREFKFVVCLYPWEPYDRPQETAYLSVQLYDEGSVPNVEMLDALGDYVKAVSKIGMTLVHCQAGLNRSGLVAALALIRDGMTPDAAINLLREKRCDAVLCNPAFEAWLRTQA
jgi:protein-tyrosine phosphatase